MAVVRVTAGEGLAVATRVERFTVVVCVLFVVIVSGLAGGTAALESGVAVVSGAGVVVDVGSSGVVGGDVGTGCACWAVVGVEESAKAAAIAVAPARA